MADWKFNIEAAKDNNNFFLFVDFQGWISTTLMFYAGYGDSELISNAGVKYNLPLAYLLVGWSFFILSLILVVRRFVT